MASLSNRRVTYVAAYVGVGDGGSKIHAVSRKKDGMLEFSLNKDRTMAMDRLSVRRRPSADTFVLVITVGVERPLLLLIL